MTNLYTFDILAQHDTEQIKQQLQNRPLKTNRLTHDANRYQPDESLKTAINTAIAIGEPLLLTGEPGTGKTQAAYYIAHKLGLDEVLHFQVKSDSTAQALLYHFDTLRYFHDSQAQGGQELDKSNYLEHGHLWTALTSDAPRVLLIDEIDKAPRDFPNDLLHELDQMSFEVQEVLEKTTDAKGNIKHTPLKIKAKQGAHPIVVITSNSEHRLPNAFLRRCVFNHIQYDLKRLESIIKQHQDDFSVLAQSPSIVELAIKRFSQLHGQTLRKNASPSELITWLRVLAMAVESDEHSLKALSERLKDESEWPPYMLQTLIKNKEDQEQLERSKNNDW